MRYFVIGLLTVLLAVAVYLWMQANDDTQDLVAQGTTLKFDAKEVAPAFSFPEDDSLDVNCMAWGPFNKSSLIRLQGLLVKSGFIDNVYVVDRYLPDRWMVYQGPFDSDAAAKEAEKKLRQAGFRSARAFNRAPVSHGVELASFNSKEEADRFLTENGTTVGLQVANQLGGLSSLSDVQFRYLNEGQKKTVRSWASNFTQAAFGKCLKPMAGQAHPISGVR